MAPTSRPVTIFAIAILLAVLPSCASNRIYSSALQGKRVSAIERLIRTDLKRRPVTTSNGRLFLVSTEGSIIRTADAPNLLLGLNETGPLDCRTISSIFYVDPADRPAPASWHSCVEVADSADVRRNQREMSQVLLRTVQFSLFLNALFDRQEVALKQAQSGIATRAKNSSDALTEVRSMRKANDQFLDEMKEKLEALKTQIGTIK